MPNLRASARSILLVSIAITFVTLVALAVTDEQPESTAVNTPAVDSVYAGIRSGFATLVRLPTASRSSVRSTVCR